MQFNRKLPAFSLMEVLISLALSSLLLFMGYVTFEFIYKQFKVFEGKSRNGLSNQLFYSYMFNDIQKAEKVITGTTTAVIECVKGDQIIKYYNIESGIVRVYKNRADTFYVKVLSFEQTNTDSPNQAGEKLVTLIKFEVELNKTKFPVSFTKDYGANQEITWKDE